MSSNSRGVTLMDFYSAIGVKNSNLYLKDILDWYWLPKNENKTVLVISVSQPHARIWIVAYTVLVGFIFMAACELATMMVLTFFTVKNSGNRQAILVAYYNAGSPAKNIRLMFGYLWTALFKCKRSKPGESSNKTWSVDWSATWASFSLFLIAFSLFSGNIITKFFLGGTRLVEGNIAKVNPDAIYYPDYTVADTTAGNQELRDVFEALKGARAPAVFQAIARRTSTAPGNLAERITYTHEGLKEGTILPDGRRLNGTGARFSYQYNLTGYEMGLLHAPGLVFAVRGSCATYHGNQVVYNASTILAGPNNTNSTELFDIYSFYGDYSRSFAIPLERERFTAPWVRLMDKTDDEARAENELYGGWTFQLVPSTAWRISKKEKTDDPWYETETNPAWVEGDPTSDEVEAPFRVKNMRPPLRCTQNDTYTYNGKTVNHVNKLKDLPDLKLSPLIRDTVFGREFGTPVFSQLLGYAPFASLVSHAQFIANQRRLDAARADMFADFKGLVEMSFIYSREVVRNTALLFPSLEGRDTVILRNSDATNADFLIESPEVAALSVFVLITTPSVGAFLWLLVFIWSTLYNPESKLDQKSAKGRHGLRFYALQAVHLYRFLDEELSRQRKWSGRNTKTPFIRDLDAATLNETIATDLPASAKSGSSPTQVTVPEPNHRQSHYAKPKLLPFHGDYEPPSLSERLVNYVRKIMFDKKPDETQFEVAMTRTWNPDLGPVPWKNIREDL